MLGGVTLRTWRRVTRRLRIAAWIAWGAAGVELVRGTGSDDRRPFWAVYLVVGGVWVLADFVLFVADRGEPGVETEPAEEP
jgi:hypothetical protein